MADLGELSKLRSLAGDNPFRAAFCKAKREAKSQFANWLKASCDQIVDPDSIFDCQIKRIHEYKRQLLNALRIIVLYDRLRQNPGLQIVPRTFFFAGKAAPGYHLAKVIIKFVNNLATVIDNDSELRGRIKVLFLAEYDVTLSERLIPARDVSNRDLDRWLRGQRDEQHEIHDERSADDRHAGRCDDRNGRGGGRR